MEHEPNGRDLAGVRKRLTDAEQSRHDLVTHGEIRVDEWRLVLTALCVDSPARIGTLGEPDTFQLIEPTNFSWLRSVRWHAGGPRTDPATTRAGIALLDLAEPGTVPAAAWEPLCGALHPAPPTEEGRILFGQFEPPGADRTAVLTLVTDFSDEGAAAAVRTVRVRVEPAEIDAG